MIFSVWTNPAAFTEVNRIQTIGAPSTRIIWRESSISTINVLDTSVIQSRDPNEQSHTTCTEALPESICIVVVNSWYNSFIFTVDIMKFLWQGAIESLQIENGMVI